MNRLTKVISLVLLASLITGCFPLPIFIPSDDDATFFPIFIPIPLPKTSKEIGEGQGNNSDKRCKSVECEKSTEEREDDYRKELYQEKNNF